MIMAEVSPLKECWDVVNECVAKLEPYRYFLKQPGEQLALTPELRQKQLDDINFLRWALGSLESTLVLPEAPADGHAATSPTVAAPMLLKFNPSLVSRSHTLPPPGSPSASVQAGSSNTRSLTERFHRVAGAPGAEFDSMPTGHAAAEHALGGLESEQADRATSVVPSVIPASDAALGSAHSSTLSEAALGSSTLAPGQDQTAAAQREATSNSSRSLPNSIRYSLANLAQMAQFLTPVSEATHSVDDTFVAIRDHRPSEAADDLEVRMRAGDLVRITMFMDNSIHALGKNITTNTEGMIPLDAIASAEELGLSKDSHASATLAEPHFETELRSDEPKPCGEHRVIKPFSPGNNLEGVAMEVTLKIGDVIKVSSWMDEYTAFGVHLPTGFEGCFVASYMVYEPKLAVEPLPRASPGIAPHTAYPAPVAIEKPPSWEASGHLATIVSSPEAEHPTEPPRTVEVPISYRATLDMRHSISAFPAPQSELSLVPPPRLVTTPIRPLPRNISHMAPAPPAPSNLAQQPDPSAAFLYSPTPLPPFEAHPIQPTAPQPAVPQTIPQPILQPIVTQPEYPRRVQSPIETGHSDSLVYQPVVSPGRNAEISVYSYADSAGDEDPTAPVRSSSTANIIRNFQEQSATFIKEHMNTVSQLKAEGKEVPSKLIVDLVRKLTQNMSHYQVDRAVQEAKMREAAVVQRGPVDPSNPAEDDNMPEVPTRIQPEATSSAAASQFSSPVAIQPLTVLRSYTPEPDTEVDIVPAPTLGKGKETLRRSTSQRSDIKVALSSDELPQKLRKELEYMQMHHTDELKQKSSRVVIELVDTERNYRNGLKTLLDLYRDRLRDSGLLKPIDIDTIFGVIPDLYRLSCDLYTQFCEALKRFEEEPYGITACFLEQIERWKIYIIYVKKFSGAKRLLREMEDKNEAFSNLLEEIQRMPECRRQDIHQFLHLPIQRMSSYWLLLDRLGKCCDRSDIQWERINGTAEYIFQIGYLLNTAQREEENVYKMFKVQQTVKNCPADLVSFSQRSYIDEFQVLDDIQRTRIMTIFLFTDCILITVDRRSMIKGDRWKYELVEKIDFKSIANELPIYFKGDDNCVLQWQTRLVSEPPPPAPASDRRANSTSKFGLSSFLNRNASSSVAENVTSPPGSSSDPGRRHPDGSSPTHARQQAYYVRFSQVAERDRFVEVVGQAFDRFKK